MGMRSVFLDVDLDFSTLKDAAESEEILMLFMGVVARKNLYYLKKNPHTPKLYSKEAGIIWSPPDQMQGSWVDRTKIRDLAAYLKTIGGSPEHVAIILRLVSGVEIFQDTQTLFKRKHGDCDRLVCARLPELWLAGVMASPYLVPHVNSSGGTTYHAIVLHPDGSGEDPSVILGMKGWNSFDRYEEIRKNYERRDNLMQAAASMVVEDGADPDMLGAAVDAAGYVPPGGYR
jgi:hypothetical protein